MRRSERASELHNAVRDGAHYGKFHPDDRDGIAQAVVRSAPRLDLTAASVTVSCSENCEPANDRLTVSAAVPFSAVTQSLLGIPPITLRSTANVAVE
jgi:hypothetical protein